MRNDEDPKQEEECEGRRALVGPLAGGSVGPEEVTRRTAGQGPWGCGGCRRPEGKGWGGTGAAAGEKGEVKISAETVPGCCVVGSETLRCCKNAALTE